MIEQVTNNGQASAPEKPVAEKPSGKKKILVVDDEKNIRLTVQHSLIAANYEVETASNGAEGLEKFKSGHYDLILMDLRMPQINGIEMLREIKARDKHAAAIVITAYLTIDTLLEAFSLGVSDYIRKPFSPNDVRETVRRVLVRETIKDEEVQTKRDPAAMLELARKVLGDNDISSAIEYARKSIGVNPNNPDAHAFLGILLHLQDKPDEAEQAFREALLLDPQHQLSRDYLFWMQSKLRPL